ncbi:hypothetical protein GCM10010211_23800 [Streptomyces albospinus]|uniref:Transposase n=1 Tax=Streptomyces albospinus TaxID=285515 RepID=A0ABQ2UX28_9ACTN|nr:hypothetical protein GCM10010211_23800 [Streptomyces albospinus]
MCGGTIVQKTGAVGAVRFRVTLWSMDKRWHCVIRLSLPLGEIPENVWLVAFSLLRPSRPAY